MGSVAKRRVRERSRALRWEARNDVMTGLGLHVRRCSRDTGSMNGADRRPDGSPPGSGRQRGVTLLETCAALALSSVAAIGILAGLKPLSCALRVEAGRTSLVSALLEARRAAYAHEASIVVETAAGRGDVVIRPPGSVRGLGDGVTISSAPSDGNVQFHASGLADNATLAIACSNSVARVVVNQRGVIR